MTHFLTSGNIVKVESSDSLTVSNLLAPLTYVVKVDKRTSELYLELTNDFVLPLKMYGDSTEKRALRIIKTFNDRVKSTGVLLLGDKGSGKTLLTKKVASIVQTKHKMPVIIINEPHAGQEFNQFIAKIDQPALVVFDEFDKTYDNDEQEKLLTLLDGTVESKKLFIFTANAGHIDDHLLNRPGRIYYKFQYGGLDQEFIQDYIAENLDRLRHADELIRVCQSFSCMTFDMLQAMVEEVDRYDESPVTVMHSLNVDISCESTHYSITVFVEGERIRTSVWPDQYTLNPLYNSGTIDFQFDVPDCPDFQPPSIERGCQTYKVLPGGTIKYDLISGCGKKVSIVFEKRQSHSFNFMAV